MEEEDSTQTFREGTLIAGRYLIQGRIGSGGMGAVYRVLDKELDNQVVALKLLHPHLAENEQCFRRFRNEVLVARSLSHPNIVRIHDIGRDATGYSYISMELVEGSSLKEYLVDEMQTPRALGLEEAVKLLFLICSGVSYAHERKIMHRDLKPANVLITNSKEVKIVDFGTARATGADNSMTQAGQMIGTPDYMSPEQVRGEKLDESCDIYALGIMSYEMICGHRPYEADNAVSLAYKHIHEAIPPVVSPIEQIPPWFEQFVVRAMAKDKSARFPSVAQMVSVLGEYLATASQKSMVIPTFGKNYPASGGVPVMSDPLGTGSARIPEENHASVGARLGSGRYPAASEQPQENTHVSEVRQPTGAEDDFRFELGTLEQAGRSAPKDHNGSSRLAHDRMHQARSARSKHKKKRVKMVAAVLGLSMVLGIFAVAIAPRLRIAPNELQNGAPRDGAATQQEVASSGTAGGVTNSEPLTVEVASASGSSSVTGDVASVPKSSVREKENTQSTESSNAASAESNSTNQGARAQPAEPKVVDSRGSPPKEPTHEVSVRETGEVPDEITVHEQQIQVATLTSPERPVETYVPVKPTEPEHVMETPSRSKELIVDARPIIEPKNAKVEEPVVDTAGKNIADSQKGASDKSSADSDVGNKHAAKSVEPAVEKIKPEPPKSDSSKDNSKPAKASWNFSTGSSVGVASVTPQVVTTQSPSGVSSVTIVEKMPKKTPLVSGVQIATDEPKGEVLIPSSKTAASLLNSRSGSQPVAQRLSDLPTGPLPNLTGTGFGTSSAGSSVSSQSGTTGFGVGNTNAPSTVQRYRGGLEVKGEAVDRGLVLELRTSGETVSGTAKLDGFGNFEVTGNLVPRGIEITLYSAEYKLRLTGSRRDSSMKGQYNFPAKNLNGRWSAETQ